MAENSQRHYLCIDLKSFYASVECVERGLDPMKTDLVVADPERTKGTICLAVSPSLKEKGVKNRCRLFEIPDRLMKNTIIAPPRMQKYIDYAANIYGVYLDYLSQDDIYVYSIDEAFLDVTSYLKLYQKTPEGLAKFLMQEVLEKTGVRATAGVGTNLYLAKIALDITAKHSPYFIGVLDEKSYRDTLWDHRPLTDFWRIGPGTARTLEKHRIFTMGDLAHADKDTLYRVFGKDAELLIDHAWGREPVTLKDIKNYQSHEKSYSSGQVLPREYNYEETRLALHEMVRDLCLRLTREGKIASSASLSLGYSYQKTHEKAAAMERAELASQGSFIRSTRFVPHGTVRFDIPTSATSVILENVDRLYQKIAIPSEKYRRIYLGFSHLAPADAPVQTSLFSDLEKTADDAKIQEAMLDIQKKYGKTAILRGEDLEEGSTARWRSDLIGGHKRG